MEKLKVFLDGYVNTVNAQNINCENIAIHLDKEKFEVYSLYDKNKPINHVKYKNINLRGIQLKQKQTTLQKFVIMLFGNYDIYFFSKLDTAELVFAKLFGKWKCIVSSVEITETVEDKYYDFFNRWCTDYFCISEFLRNYTCEKWGHESKVLYLGHNNSVESDKERNSLKRVAFVGSVKERKRPMLFLECAKEFPNISFVMIGSGDQLDVVKKYITDNKLKNVEVLGQLDNNEVYRELDKCDLMLMTSKQEGLPKVILEAASCGIPTIYINEYYEVDYVKNGYNGYSVPNVNEMKKTISYLINNDDIYAKISKNVKEIVPKYEWKSLISGYENYFSNTYSKKFLNDK